MPKYKWEEVRDFMVEVFRTHYSNNWVMIEAGRRMRIITTKLCVERGLDENPNQLFGSDVGLGPKSSDEFEKLKRWYAQHQSSTS